MAGKPGGRHLKVAIVGAHTTGKSTLVRHLAAYYANEPSVTVSPDPARSIIERSGDTDFLAPNNIDLERQFAVVIEQLIQHFLAPKESLTIYDRHFIDQIAYVEAANENICNRAAWKIIRSTLLERAKDITFYIHARPFTSIPADDVKEDHIFLQNRIDILIARYLDDIGAETVDASGEMSNRFNAATAAINKLLNGAAT